MPAYVALPTELLRPCVVDMPTVWTNGALAQYAIDLRACLAAANDRLNRIEGLQP